MRLARSLSFAPLALALATNPAVSAAQEAAVPAGLRATYLSQPPVIDGRLDDDAWSAAPLKTGEWKSYNPLHGDTVPQQTTVLNAVLELLARPEMRDIRAFMKDCPSNLTVYDPMILKVLSGRPRDWDLFASYARWKIRESAAAMRARELPRRVANRFRRRRP